MNQQTLSSLIWSVADLLRGDYKPSEYGRVILPFLVLRRLDQVAYVRFASVYRQFEDVNAFREEIEQLERQLTPEARRQQLDLLDDDA